MNAINEEPEHREIEALLPWYAAGTLSRRDANRVEQALAGDRELARQYDLVREELVETIHLNETLGAPSARAMERLFAAIVGPSPAHRRRIRKVDLRKLLHRVETAPIGSPELDSEFESTFCSVPSHVTRSIDAATRLVETELPGWWWNCGHCALRNGASLYVPGSSQIRVNYPSAGTGPDFGPRPEHLRLLQDPKWGTLFDSGFHCDRAGTVPLAMLAVFLEAKLALTLVQPEALGRRQDPEALQTEVIGLLYRAEEDLA
jgi:hypothetical protein